jgi:glycosyltransferase involved in cell wall biosynthesis
VAEWDRLSSLSFLFLLRSSHPQNDRLESLSHSAKFVQLTLRSGRMTTTGGERLRIVGIDPERRFAGGESQVLGLSLELLALGHDAQLLCDPDGLLWQRARAAGISCHPLRIRNALDCLAGMKLRGFLSRHRFDVAHFHTSRAHSMAPFAAGLASALVVTRRMDYVPNRWFAPFLFNRAVDGVAAISQGVANALIAAGVSPDRIKVIPSGVDCVRFHPPSAEEKAAARSRLGCTPEQVVLGAVGALEPRKAHRYLLDALALLRRRNRPVRLYIAGQGSLRSELEAESQRLDLADAVVFLGSIADPLTLFWAIDIFVQPSLMEGLGVALLEAMACGLPAVASRAGGMAEVIEDALNGRLVAAADPGGLAQALEELAGSPALRRSLGDQARIKADQKFSIKMMAQSTLALYQSILARKAQPCAA